MDCTSATKPHAVCVPFPAQGHINGMLRLAMVLYSKGFHITFVNTEHNHRRIVNSSGPAALHGEPDFRFETIPDGLPIEDANTSQDLEALARAIRNNCFTPFRQLVGRLNEPSSGVPPVTCIISDIITCFTLEIASELGIPDVLFCSTSACGYMSVLQYEQLVQRGIVPFKDESYLTNGYLNTPVDWIPGMNNIRLRDLSTFIRITNHNDILFNIFKNELKDNSRATGIIINTFDDLEGPVLSGISSILSLVYTIGPLPMLSHKMQDNPLRLSLWKEDPSFLNWLQGRETNSVVYVNFGSFTVMTDQQLVEFAWGLANSGYDFLWVIRPDLVAGDSAVLLPEFLSEIRGRGMLASWCPQEKVLRHEAVGGFLTHCGWNSTLESLTAGVPMICWPFFADQQMNCRYLCVEWEIGMEIDNDVKRKDVGGMISELMEGEKGKEMRKKAVEWKERAVRATEPGGSTFTNLNKLIKKLIIRESFI